MSADVLNSWKEIAAYAQRGVRTVQRWEQEIGFPIRRPRGKGSAVVALKSEIDSWFRRAHDRKSPNLSHRRYFAIHRRLINNRKITRRMVARLIDGRGILRREMDRALKLASTLRSAGEVEGGQAASPKALKKYRKRSV